MGGWQASNTAVALRKTDAWGCNVSDCETLAKLQKLGFWTQLAASIERADLEASIQ